MQHRAEASETLKDENIQLIQRLEELTQQAIANESLIQQKEQEYQLKVAAIEREVSKYIAQKHEESQKIVFLLDSKLKQTEDEKKQMDSLIEKTKQQNQEITKELIEVNREASSAQNELKLTRKELKQKSDTAKEF